MTLKESIINSAKGIEETNSKNIIYSTLIKAFAHDYELIGEETIDYYVDLFGEESISFFKNLSKNSIQLLEYVNNFNGSMLFEQSDEEIGEFYLIEAGLKDSIIDGISRRKANKAPDTSSAVEYDPKLNADNLKNGIMQGKISLGKKFAGETARVLPGHEPAETAEKITRKASETVDSIAKKSAPDTEAVSKAVATKGWLAALWDNIVKSGTSIENYFKENPDVLKTMGITGASIAGAGAAALIISKVLKSKGVRKATHPVRLAKA